MNDIMRNVELKTKQQTIYDEFIGLCDKDNSPSDFPKLPNDTSDYITGIWLTRPIASLASLVGNLENKENSMCTSCVDLCT